MTDSIGPTDASDATRDASMNVPCSCDWRKLIGAAGRPVSRREASACRSRHRDLFADARRLEPSTGYAAIPDVLRVDRNWITDTFSPEPRAEFILHRQRTLPKMLIIAVINRCSSTGAHQPVLINPRASTRDGLQFPIFSLKTNEVPAMRTLLCLFILSGPACLVAQESTPRQEVLATLNSAAEWYHKHASSHGGYVYHYSLDLKQRWGEGEASADQIWVQPPGTPTVGMAFLDAWSATGDDRHLMAAVEAGLAIVYGQMKSGGWTNCVDFNPKGDRVALYRNGKGRGRNTSSLDDGQTQSAIRLLIRLDQTLSASGDTRFPQIHEAAITALDALLGAQYPNGAFPQVWDDDVMPDPPRRKAGYPDYDWRVEGQIKSYWNMYTLNDNVCGYVADTLIDAWRVYGDEKYVKALERLGSFLLDAQMPEPQPGWAQQYNYDMQPIWARKFEPPGVSGDETQETIETLLKIARVTGDNDYLKPIPAALAWLKRSTLSDGRLARYYELETNRPLYMERTGKNYRLTYDDSQLPGHYGWKWESRLDELEAAFRRVREGQAPLREPLPTAREIRAIMNSLESPGRWISTADGTSLIGAFKPVPGTRFLSSEVFSHNVSTLSRWLTTTNR